MQDAVNPIPVAGGEGRYFWDYDGKRYLDFASQLVNLSLGHQHPKLIQAIKDQADKLCTIGPPMATEPRSTLARLLAEVTPGDLSMAFFTNGGAEANENAIKLARWYTGRHKVIARYRSYHGATAGAITLTGDPRRWPAEPGIPGVVRMFDPYTYRCPAGHPDPCPVCTGAPHLEEILQYEGARHRRRRDPRDGHRDERRHRPAGRLPAVDPRGLRPARHPAHLRRGDGRLRPHGQVVRVRELGRRPGHPHRREGHQLRLRAARRDGRSRSSSRDWVRDKPFAGGLTYSGHPLACASAVASIEVFREEGIVENAAEHGPYLATRCARCRSGIRRSATCAASGSSGGSSSCATARRASRSCRSTRAARRGAGGAADEGRARRAASTSSSLERDHARAAAEHHARGARRGPRDSRRGARRRGRVHLARLLLRERRRCRAAPLSFSLQFAFVPVQSPDQPVNLEPAAAVAFNVTDAPSWKAAEQVVPQLIPVGLDVTLPVRSPPS